MGQEEKTISQKNDEKIILRLASKLKKDLQKESGELGISMNQYIIAILVGRETAKVVAKIANHWQQLAKRYEVSESEVEAPQVPDEKDESYFPQGQSI